jgi:hypothetical protein
MEVLNMEDYFMMDLKVYESDLEYFSDINKESDIQKLKRLVSEYHDLQTETITITETELIVNDLIYNINNLDLIETNLEINELINCIIYAVKENDNDDDEELPF